MEKDLLLSAIQTVTSLIIEQNKLSDGKQNNEETEQCLYCGGTSADTPKAKRGKTVNRGKKQQE